MFTINDDLSVYVTRGDKLFFTVTAVDDGKPYVFQPGDIVRIKVYGKKNAENVVLQKDFPVVTATEGVEIYLTESDTKIGDVISKPVDYWYEVELNPYDHPQTIIGYDEDGAKVFRLLPEGRDMTELEPDIKPEDIPIVDKVLDMTSLRPVQNQAIARAVAKLEAAVKDNKAASTAKDNQLHARMNDIAETVLAEQKRLDIIISGSTLEPDAEIADVRVGADGTTYESAGTAVRTQISRTVGKEFVACGVSDWIEGETKGNGHITDSAASACYRTPIIECDPAKSFRLENGNTFYRVNTYSGLPCGVDTAVAQYITPSEFTPNEYERYLIATVNKLDFVEGNERVIGGNNTSYNDVLTEFKAVKATLKDAYFYGVRPTNSGDENKANLQKLLDIGGEIVLNVPGVYEMTGRLEIGSDTTLKFGTGVYIKRNEGGDAILLNKGAVTGKQDKNIVIDGLRLICNGKNGSPYNSIQGMRGQISLLNIRDSVIRNFICEDIPANTYCLHLCDFENMLIENSVFEGQKDAIHVNTGHGLTIRKCTFKTYDDCIALNAHDYVTGTRKLGWIEDVLVENCIEVNGTVTGFFARLLGGAWSDWASGNEYRYGDIVVANNALYRMVSGGEDALYVSTIRPSHAFADGNHNGDKAYADGITWRYVQDDVIYKCGCREITFRNINFRCDRSERAAVSIHFDNGSFSRSVYPGADLPVQSNITFDNVATENATKILVQALTPFDLVRIVNSKLAADTVVNGNCAYTTKGNVIMSNDLFTNSKTVKVETNANTQIALYENCNIML